MDYLHTGAKNHFVSKKLMFFENYQNVNLHRKYFCDPKLLFARKFNVVIKIEFLAINQTFVPVCHLIMIQKASNFSVLTLISFIINKSTKTVEFMESPTFSSFLMQFLHFFALWSSAMGLSLSLRAKEERKFFFMLCPHFL